MRASLVLKLAEELTEEGIGIVLENQIIHCHRNFNITDVKNVVCSVIMVIDRKKLEKRKGEGKDVGGRKFQE